MEAILAFGRGRQKWLISSSGECVGGGGGGLMVHKLAALLLSHLKQGVRGGGEVSLEAISRLCLPISPLLSTLLQLFFFNISFAYFWLAVRLFLDKKLDR